MQRAPVDARHSSIRPPSRASCPEWALQTRASACSSLSRVTDEPPCAKRPLRGTGELRCSHFPLHVRGSYTVTLSWLCLLDPQLDDSSHFLLAPKFLSAGPSELFWGFLHGDVCRIIPKMLLNFIFMAQLSLKFSGKMAAFITSWRTWRFSAVVSFSCGFRFPSLSSTDEVESSTLGQSGVDSVPFIQSQQR